VSETPAYQRFFAELKRRHVFRIAAVYGGVGFVIVQAADVFIPALHLPPWIMTAVALLVVLGFPIAVLIAWAFELTPEGLRRTEDAGDEELDAIAAQPAGRRWPIGLAALAGVILIGLSAWWLATGRIRGTGTYDSIAVLPFANLSGNEDLEYFSDGLSEELLNALAGVEDLRVAARTSSFAFKGTNADIRTIADSLGVETVLEGSVRRSGDQVRITVQLIDAEHGFHLWSHEYDRGLEDVFATQDEIASAVTAALLPRLRDEEAPMTRGGTKNVQAYDLYLKGREKWRTRDVDLLNEAVDDFRAAIDQDPAFAMAWSGLADAIDALVWRDLEAVDLLPEGRLAALRALALEPEMAEGWASAGVLAAEFDGDYEVGELALRRALQLRPSYANANQQLSGVLANTGRVQDGLRYMERAVALDPLSGFFHLNFGDVLSVAGEFDRAREAYEKAEELAGDGLGALKLLAYARLLGLSVADAEAAAVQMARNTGLSDPEGWRVIGEAIVTGDRVPEAIALLDRAEDLPPRRQFLFRPILGQVDETIAYLQEMQRSGAGDLWRIGVFPEWDSLREDPRFIAIVKSFGIPNGYDRVAKRPIWPE
jgi:TolB-like protein/cytochrome c-type biogenesis protein CcmH/NrfG